MPAMIPMAHSAKQKLSWIKLHNHVTILLNSLKKNIFSFKSCCSGKFHFLLHCPHFQEIFLFISKKYIYTHLIYIYISDCVIFAYKILIMPHPMPEAFLKIHEIILNFIFSSQISLIVKKITIYFPNNSK